MSIFLSSYLRPVVQFARTPLCVGSDDFSSYKLVFMFIFHKVVFYCAVHDRAVNQLSK